MWKAKENHHINIPSVNIKCSQQTMAKRKNKTIITHGNGFIGEVVPGRESYKVLQVVNKRNPCKRIGTWNARTMLQTGKLENVKIEMDRLNIEILGLCETRWDENGDFTSDQYRIIHSGRQTGKAGVAVILSSRWAQSVIGQVTISDRLIMVKLRSYPNDTIILQVYMPTSTDDIGEVEKVYEDIEELIKLTKHKDNLIIIGDFNAVIGEGSDGIEVGKYGLGKRNDRGDRLLEFCRQHELVISNTLFNNHKRRRYTWKMPGDLGRYQIDFILVRNRFKNQVKSCNTYPGADINSDHNLVMMKCDLKFKKIKKPIKKYHKWNLDKLKIPEIAEKYQNKSDEKISCQMNLELARNDISTENRWEKIKEAITLTADKFLERKKHDPKQKWITQEIINDIQKRRALKNKNDPDSIRKYRALINKINREARRAKEKWIESQCQEVDILMKSNSQDKAYKAIKAYFGVRKTKCTHIKDTYGNILIDEEKIADRWKEYVESLYKNNDPELFIQIQENGVTERHDNYNNSKIGI